MTPAELCKSGSEHGQQRALFAWCAMAEKYGFDAAWDERSYGKGGTEYAAEMAHAIRSNQGYEPSVSEFALYHAIPNGGSRGDDPKSRAIRGAQLKAEGVKPGIPDTFLPLPMWAIVGSGQLPDGTYTTFRAITYAGLYIEMKREKSEGRAKGSTSNDQDEVIAQLRRNGYAVSVCFTWDAAARDLQSYIEAVRKG
jgi:hypothetical protein